MTIDPFAFRPARDDDRPLYGQLLDHLAAAIASGALGPGARLPSTRRLADDLGLHRSTVVEAYRRLAADGLIEQRVGSGTRVLPQGPFPAAPGKAPRHGSLAVRELERLRGPEPPGESDSIEIDFARIAPDERGFPADELRDCLARVLDTRGGGALSYGSPAGDPLLRESLAERLQRRGLTVSPADVLVVSGAQQGLDLVFRAVLDPGAAVTTETPTYHMALDLLRLHRAALGAVPVSFGTEPGTARLDAIALEREMQRRPALFYSAPTFQNPTGLSLDAESRSLLARSCAAAGTLLVEDDYEADVAHDGDAPRPVATLPEAGETVYVGTLSKALFPGLRLGWVVASPPLLARIGLVKRLSDLSGSVLLQAAAAELLRSGAYDRHLTVVVAEARLRMRALVDALDEHLPEGCHASRPRGGHALWLQLPRGLSARAVAQAAASRGVAVAAGDAFQHDGAEAEGLRLSISRVDRGQAARGARILGEVIAEALDEAGGREGLQRASLDRPVRV